LGVLYDCPFVVQDHEVIGVDHHRGLCCRALAFCPALVAVAFLVSGTNRRFEAVQRDIGEER